MADAASVRADASSISHECVSLEECQLLNARITLRRMPLALRKCFRYKQLLRENSGEPIRLSTSGPASETNGTNLLALRTSFGKPQFELLTEPGKPARLIQRSTVEKNVYWEVKQTADTVRPSSKHYNPRSHAAKSAKLGSDGRVEWGGTKQSVMN